MNLVYFRHLLRAFGFSLFLFFLGAADASAQTPELGTARVVKVEGTAFATKADSEERVALRGGDSVHRKTTLVTEAKSRLVLLFSNGAAMTLGPDTTMTIEEYLQEAPESRKADPGPSSTHLFLEYGEITGNVEGLDARSDFEVKTPLGTAGIRGTTFQVTFDAVNVILVVGNIDGTVEWFQDEELIEILAGQQLTIRGVIRDDGVAEVRGVSTSAIASAEVRRVVRSLMEAIFLRVNEGRPEGRLLLPFTPYDDRNRVIISPSQ